MATPHISAEKGDIAERVLLPGDPLRAKHIAATFLDNPVCYNETRGMLGYTGYYKGERVSVQGTGMGMPSFSIYCNELISVYGCSRLIRVGTCGTNSPSLNLRDIFIAQASSTDNAMNTDRFGTTFHYAPIPSFKLLKNAYEISEKRGLNVTVGECFSSDSFYDDRHDKKMALMRKLNIMAEEMESAELYTLGALKGVETLALFTVSDNILTRESTSSKEREKSFNDMILVALDTLLS